MTEFGFFCHPTHDLRASVHFQGMFAASGRVVTDTNLLRHMYEAGATRENADAGLGGMYSNRSSGCARGSTLTPPLLVVSALRKG